MLLIGPLHLAGLLHLFLRLIRADLKHRWHPEILMNPEFQEYLNLLANRVVQCFQAILWHPFSRLCLWHPGRHWSLHSLDFHFYRIDPAILLGLSPLENLVILSSLTVQ